LDRRTACLAILVAPSWGASAQNTEVPAFSAAEMHVRLLAPLATKLNRKGDMVPARIVEPAALQGGILEGDIREIHAGGTKRSIIEFQFHTLHLSGSKLPISATLVSLSNSKRQSGSDEDGSPIDTGQAEENSKHLPLFRKLGGQGEKSFSHSASVVQLSTHASNLSLAIGSELILQVDPRKE
jgi:hypothetical protein